MQDPLDRTVRLTWLWVWVVWGVLTGIDFFLSFAFSIYWFPRMVQPCWWVCILGPLYVATLAWLKIRKH